MSSDQLNDFINAQHALNVTMSAALGRIEQSQKDTNLRLFGGDGQQGAMPYLAAEVKSVSKRVGKLETWRTGTVRWIAGVVAVLTLEGALIGFYLSHVSAKVQSVIGIR